MRTIALLLVLAGCPSKSEPSANPQPAPSASSAAPVATTAVDAGPPKKTPMPPMMVVEQWNVAHIKHDTKALENLYAAHVQFYGQSFTNKQCVDAKKKAFEKTPDYTQTIRDIDAKPDGTVTFTKTSTSKGKSTDYPAIVVVVNGVITAETDKITDANLAAAAAAKSASWCMDEPGLANDKVVAPYTISLGEALSRSRLTKHFAEQQKAASGQFIDFQPMSCPTKCNSAAHDCGYDMRLENHDPTYTSPSNLIEWVYVDAVEAKLYWDDGKSSEALPPKR